MKLDYRILWIDDRIEEHRADGHLARIESFLKEKGFVPQIVECEDKSQVEVVINTERFDLILTDYNLEEDADGEVIIKEIREGHIFTEILFYSAVDDFWKKAENILKIDRLSYYQISQGGFSGLLDKVEWLITQTISKLQELTAMRGLMMAETSGLDSLLGELVIALINRPEMAEKNKEIFDKSNQSNAEYFKESAEKFDKYFSEGKFEDFVKSSTLYGKWQILRKFVKDIEVEHFSADTLKDYNREITELRNKLAHLKHSIVEGRHHLSFKSSDGTIWEFNDDRCVEIRTNLKKHTDNLVALATYLNIEVDE